MSCSNLTGVPNEGRRKHTNVGSSENSLGERVGDNEGDSVGSIAPSGLNVGRNEGES